MDGRVYLPIHAEVLSKEIKLKIDEKEKTQTLIIVRDEKNVLELEYIPSLHFKDIVKEEIITDITMLTEGKLTGWTHEAQKGYLNAALNSIKLENEVLIKSFADQTIKSTLLDLMLYSKYILQYRKKSTDHDKELYYINLFKEKLSHLIAQHPEIKQLIHALTETRSFLRILPLAYHEIIKNDDMILDFRASELIGHNVAYAVGKNEDKFKKLLVVNKQGAILETYAIQEIKVLKDKKRDLALKGMIAIPLDDKQEKVTTVYITWTGTHNDATKNADLERTPGEESYRCGEDQILKQIISTIESLGRPVRIIICGHSLGGALAQLSFHSLQRVIAAQLNDELIEEKITALEEQFSKELLVFSPHQRKISDIKINYKIIKEMSVDVWNSAGVLQPIINHTNQLCPILVNAGIAQLANFGLVGADLLQAFGQGYILNNVFENGAKIKILKIQSKLIDQIMSTVGLPAAATAAVLASNPAILFVSLFCLFAISAKVIKDKSIAHRKHHFLNGTRPEDAYLFYNSHNSDGSINADACKIINAELSMKSRSIIDSGMEYISDTFMQDERFKSEFWKLIEVCKQKRAQEEKPNYDDLLNFLIKRLQTDEVRILDLIKEKQILDIINTCDAHGKTMLHHALARGQFRIAQALIDMDCIDVNIVDKENNFPLLIFMQHMHNYYLPFKKEAVYLGIKLLEKTTIDLVKMNKQGQSVEKFYKKWYWSGSSAKQFMAELNKRLPVHAKPKVEHISMPPIAVNLKI